MAKPKNWVFYNADDFLNDVREKYGFTSDYQLAKHWDIDPSRISKYRHQASTFDDGLCRKIEKELKLPKGFVAAYVQGERHSDPELRDYWKDIQREMFAKIPSLAIALTLGSALFMGAPESLDITPGFTQVAAQATDFNIDYAHFAVAAKTALCGMLLALWLKWTRICSARSL